ncbi:MAG: UDP-galactose--lipooligosaccharide galactosyltransferase, partial [Oscillospiraceae bacterium]|nr:UDP-galactose--lipooligosaccharide galactosyltransferase [Oscillospiraceae bacterium]
FEEDNAISVVGSNIAEFVGSGDNIIACREVPTEHSAICKFLKKRDPFNHMTVFLRKSHVLAAGGYLPWHFNEDSYLWARMYLSGAKFANISENLVYARVGEEMYARRGGYKYFKSEKGILKFKRKNRIIGFGTYLSQVILRFIAECMLPNKLRGWLYKKHLRKAPN